MGNSQSSQQPGSQSASLPQQQNLSAIPLEKSQASVEDSKFYDDDEPITQSTLQADTTIPIEDIEGAVKLSLQLKKKLVQSSSFNEQTFPMLASLKIENIKSQNKAPLDLICVIDHSGSMSGEKMSLVQNTFNFLLNYLGDNDRLSIVIFDHFCSRLFPLIRTTSENKAIILSHVQKIEANGGTNINLGMRSAFKILKERKYKNPVSSIFLLSDGLDGKAQDRVRQSLTEMNVDSDVTINTFGFGKDHDPQLMNDLAALRDGNFYFIKQLDTVDEAFVDCLGGLLSAIGQNTFIKIKPEQTEQLSGVKIVKAYGDSAMWAREGDVYITKISTLITGIQKDFVLELSIPANKKELQDHEKDVKVASGEATFTTLDGKQITARASLNITLLNEGEEVKDEEEDNREVMKNFFRVKGALVMDDARNLADESKNEEAQKLLRNFKEELENSFLKNEEFIKNLVKDIEQAIQNVEPEVYHDYGRHGMIENTRAQMYQKSNMASANCYQNEMQSKMMFSVKAMKSKK